MYVLRESLGLGSAGMVADGGSLIIQRARLRDRQDSLRV
jgi:hypothetical protein